MKVLNMVKKIIKKFKKETPFKDNNTKIEKPKEKEFNLMTQEQRLLLKNLNLPIYAFAQEDLLLLKQIIDDELDIRQDIRNKELKLKLASEVELKTNVSQNLEKLMGELFVSRKRASQRLSSMDEYKGMEGIVPRTPDGRIIGESTYTGSILDPILDESEIILDNILDENETMLKPILDESQNMANEVTVIKVNSPCVYEAIVRSDGLFEMRVVE